jgi:urease accessory protein
MRTILAKPRRPPRALRRKRAPAGACSTLSAKASRSCLDPAALCRLMTWLSPAYPVGAFSYSSGLEWAVESGDINDAETLRRWIETLLSDGAGMSDGIFFCSTYRAIVAVDDAALTRAAELAAALVPTRERYHETTALGRAFVEITRTAWPCPGLDHLVAIWRGAIAYPVAVAAACAGHGVALGPALHAFLTAIAANWVSAGIRLVPLGHTDGQRVLHALEPAIASSAQRALATRLDEVGTATFRADLAGIRHETQQTRLFRS